MTSKERVVLNASGTATNNISLTDAPFAIGAWFNGGTPVYPIDGLIDEVVVFRDILTTGEIDQIRQGTYADVSTPTTTTTPPCPTTTHDTTTTDNDIARWHDNNDNLPGHDDNDTSAGPRIMIFLLMAMLKHCGVLIMAH